MSPTNSFKLTMVIMVVGVLAAIAACRADDQYAAAQMPSTAQSIVTVEPGGYGMAVHEFCYRGAKYIMADRGIAPKYVPSENGDLIVQTCD